MMLRLSIFAVATALLLAACAPPGPGVRPDRVDDPDIIRIQQLEQQQDYSAAARAWEQLAAERPEQAGHFRIRAAEAWLMAGDTDSAAGQLDAVDTRALSFTDQVRLDMARAELMMLRGDLATAGWLLAHSADRLPAELRPRYRALEAELARLESSPARVNFEALKAELAGPDFKPELALELLLEHPRSELEALVYEASDHPELLVWLDLVITAREVLLDDQRLESALASWQRRFPAADLTAEDARLWIAAWHQTRPMPTTIAISLPGRGSSLHRPGQALRDGLLSAWLEWPPERRPVLLFSEVDDDEESIITAWYDARERGADLMLGPLDRRHVNRLLAQPDVGILPVMTFNLPDEPEWLTEAMGAVSAIALPPEEEAELAAVRALVDGHRRALVLTQYTPWGERVAQAFIDAFELGGGRVAENRLYDVDSVDHSQLLSEMLKLPDSEQRIRDLQRLLGTEIESEPSRRTDVDVIFLASRAGDGRLIPPQLRFFDAGGVPIMSTSMLVSGAPNPGRDRDLDNVLIPIPPWFIDATPQGDRRRQAERQHGYLDNPTLARLYALGRDAMLLVPWLDMMRADPTLYLPGATGRLTLADGHSIQRDLPFVKLTNGRARVE